MGLGRIQGVLTADDERVVLQTAEGRESLTAADIYALTAHDRTDRIELLQPAGATVPNIAFMSRPLDVFVWVRNDEQAGLNATAAISLSGQTHALRDPSEDHILSNNVWHPLDPISLHAARNCLNLDNNDASPLAAYAGIYRGLDSTLNVQDDIDMDKLRALIARDDESQPLVTTLYPYQKAGYQWLSEAAEAGLGCILADEMGLGKTIQVIALLAQRCARGLKPSLVIVPVTLIENWKREIHRFAPALRVNVHHGASRARYGGAFSAVDVVLVGYDTAARDVGVFVARHWDIIVMDEAQNVKNPRSLRAQLLRQFPRTSAVMVTGTPIENSTTDLWSLTDFAVPGYLGDQEHFASALAEQPQLLAQAIKPVLLRRELSDVATDLPDRIDVDVILEMFHEEAVEYFRLISSVRKEVKGSNALALITKLRQYTAHPSVAHSLTSPDPLSESAKLARLREMLDEIFAANDKVLVFSAFRAASDLIHQVIQSRMHVPAWIMDGRTPVQSRQGLIDLFSGQDGAAALVLHPVTGGAGLNITAANHVIHYTLEWNPAKEAQATARSFRRGQELPVRVHRLIYADTIDEAIVQTLATKRELTDTVIGPTDSLGLDILARTLRARTLPSPTIAQGEKH